MKEIKLANKFIFWLLLYEIVIKLVFELIKLNTKSMFLLQLICMFMPIVFYFLVTNEKISDVIKLNKISRKNICVLILLAFVIQPVMIFFAVLGELFAKDQNRMKEILNMILGNNLLTAIFLFAFIPAIFEEIIFRGIFFFGYRKTNPITKAIFINSLAFAALHLNFQQFFYAFAMGWIFCLIDFSLDSIIPSMVLHFIFNATQVSKIYLSTNAIGLNQFKNLYNMRNYILQDNIIPSILIPFFISLFFFPVSIYLLNILIKDFKNKNQSVTNNYVYTKTGKIFTWSLILYLTICFLFMR